MKNYLLFYILFATFFINKTQAQNLPTPAHIVVVIYENQAYSGIIGNTAAPFINGLTQDANTASFTNMYANSTSASQPNYFYLFSGSDQGISSNTIPSNTPFTSPNLGYSLISTSHSFIEYSEGLPSVGWLGTTSGNYDRKHNPASDWQGSLSNNIPATCNQPFSSFPTNFDSLPTVSFVVPNEANNMHSGTIAAGDNWLKNNFNSYLTWAKTHNSLLIFTFDEDDGAHGNHVVTFFSGAKVKGGTYTESLTLLNILRTMEDMYGLTKCGSTTTSTPITDIWSNNTGINAICSNEMNFKVSPVPAYSEGIIDIQINTPFAQNASFALYDITGKIIKEEKFDLNTGNNQLPFALRDVTRGVYFLRAMGKELFATKKIVVE